MKDFTKRKYRVKLLFNVGVNDFEKNMLLSFLTDALMIIIIYLCNVPEKNFK